MEAKKLKRLSLAEYLDLEQSEDVRYEYHDGYLTAMAGGSLNHGLICGNVFGEIREGLKRMGNPCRVINSEVKLHVEAVNSFLYPDAQVICGTIQKSKTEKNAVTNPTLIVEVLSRSTANYDRGDKFFFYRQIPSLEEYVLIEQEKPLVEIYSRQSGLWDIRRFFGLQSQLELKSLGLHLAMDSLYQDVEFPEL
jgi:Uma2 family endonuclease